MVSHLGRLAPAVFLAALAFLLALPFYRQPMVVGHDSHFHFANALEYGESLADGTVVAHLAPNYYGGLGSASFKFYPPYSYLPVSLLHRAGVPFGVAWGVAFTLALLVSGLGMFLWARTVASRLAATGAAVFYVLAPYHLDDLYCRFAYPELWGFALAPWVLWTATIAARAPFGVRTFAPAICLAMTALVHNLTAFALALLLPVYWCLFAGLRPAVVGRLVFVALLTAGLTAFYVLPAWLDRGEVLMSRQFADVASYAEHAFSWDSFIRRTGDRLPWRPAPGWPFLLLGGCGVVLLARERKSEGLAPGRAVLASAAIALALTTRPAVAVAEVFSPLRHVQFPWRFLLPVNLFLAFGAVGLPLWDRVDFSMRALALRGGLVLLAIVSVLWTFATPGYWRETIPKEFSYPDVIRRFYWKGDVENKYCPLAAEDAVVKGYREGNGTVWKCNGVKAAAVVLETAERLRLTVSGAAERWTVVLRRHWVPGWRVLYGAAIVELDAETGLMRVAGEGDDPVVLGYRGSETYRVGRGVSLAAMVAALALFIVLRRRKEA